MTSNHQSSGPDEAQERADDETERALPSATELAATIRSSVATAAAAARLSREAGAVPTVRSSDGAAPRTLIAEARPATPPSQGPVQARPPGWLPAAIGTTMRIAETLPASGAEADLYIVDDAAGTRHVAKVYRQGIAPKEEVLDRIREARATHVVRLEDYGVEDGRWWELLEYIEHGNLRDRIAEAGGALPEADVRRVLAQLADGLDSLHAIGLEHRDLKPENVLVRRREPIDVVIADWGIASVLEATVHFTAMARTIRYAPPEAVGNVVTSEEGTRRTVSAIERTRWDAWSIGMMAVEMKTGAHPFGSASEQVIGHRLATQSVDALCEHVANPAWRWLCRGLLRRQPADRWGTAEVRRWLANPDDPTLTVAEDQPVRAHAGIDFDGRHFTDRRALGRALQQAGQAKAESFWKRRFADLRTWVTDTLGEGALGESLEEVDREPDLSLAEQVFCCIHLLWPEAPMVVDGVLLREDVLHELARQAWEGNDEAAAQLVRTAANPQVECAAVLDASGVTQTMHEAWKRAAEHYAAGIRILGDRVSIPEWRAAEFGMPEQRIEAETVAGVKIGVDTVTQEGRILRRGQAVVVEVEIGVDTVTGSPRLPVRIQAGILGAAIGEPTCAKGLQTMAARVTEQWKERESLLSEMNSAGAGSPSLLAVAIYGALEVQKHENEAAQHREVAARPEARKEVWKNYGIAAGCCLGAVLAVWVEFQFFEFKPTTAWFVWLYLAIAVAAGSFGSILGKRLEGSVAFGGRLSPPIGKPGTAQNWARRHEAMGNIVAKTANFVIGILMLYRWIGDEFLWALNRIL